MPKKKTDKEFKEELIRKQIPYKPIEPYDGNKKKIKFVCEKHGEFLMCPNDILSNHGCPKCGIEKKDISHLLEINRKRKIEALSKVADKGEPKTRKILAENAEKLLNEANSDGQFSFDMTNYESMSVKMPFHCIKCGNDFLRKPTVFVHDNNTCPFCNGKIRNRKYTTEEFIEKSKNLFNDANFSYEQVEYVNTDTKVRINCHTKDEFGEEHGIFEVTPHSHLGLHVGCPKCSKKYSDTDLFVKRATMVFNGFYDYSKVNYKSAFEDVIVTCKEHGDFVTKPNWHLQGRGCPLCSLSSLEQKLLGLLKEENIEYILKARSNTFEWLEGLELDFYLPQYNVAIECQGIQHFQPINFFGGEKKYAEQVEHDNRKRELCSKNNIKLLYFSNLGIDYPYQVYENEKELLKEIKNG